MDLFDPQRGFGNPLRALFLKNRDFFCYGEILVPNTRGPLGCLFGFWPSGPKPCGGNEHLNNIQAQFSKMIIIAFLFKLAQVYDTRFYSADALKMGERNLIKRGFDYYFSVVLQVSNQLLVPNHVFSPCMSVKL